MEIKVTVKILNENGEPVVGNGIVWLLEKIEETGSISAAAKKMNMAYSKAWKIIKKMEDNLNIKILIRTKGGENKGGAELTEIAKKIIIDFKRLHKSAYSAALKFINENSFLGF